jgi:hypothetical protein
MAFAILLNIFKREYMLSSGARKRIYPRARGESVGTTPGQGEKHFQNPEKVCKLEVGQ